MFGPISSFGRLLHVSAPATSAPTHSNDSFERFLLKSENGFVLTGMAAQAPDSIYATTLPGVFAVGYVRYGSVKRTRQ
jgi:thioredoxin reductase